LRANQVHDNVPLNTYAFAAFDNVNQVRDSMYYDMKYTGGWYKLLNSTSVIGSEGLASSCQCYQLDSTSIKWISYSFQNFPSRLSLDLS
jgi:hypothetical protein